uniref:HTH merR-type domain-containing protein n=1 Tax=termite gut metagenome TaxID=433724 RepID=S0DDG3_9ZZZZ
MREGDAVVDWITGHRDYQISTVINMNKGFFKEEQVPDHECYPLEEVSYMLDVDPWTIQMWVNRFGGMLTPRRDAEGNLLFTPRDVARIAEIRRMAKIKGITIHDIMKHIYMSESGQLKE